MTIEQGTPVFHPLVEPAALNVDEVENYVGTNESRHLSPDGRWLVSLAGRRYCFWRSPFDTKGQCGQTPSPWVFHGGEAIFTGDGERVLTLASGGDGNRLIEINLAGEEVTVMDSGELAQEFALSADGALIAAAGRSGELFVGRTDDAMLREAGRHSRQIKAIAFDPDGLWIATGGLDRIVHIWSTTTFESASYGFLNPVEDLAFDVRHHRWLVASGSSVFALSALQGDPSQSLLRAQEISNLRVDPDNSAATVVRPADIRAFD